MLFPSVPTKAYFVQVFLISVHLHQWSVFKDNKQGFLKFLCSLPDPGDQKLRIHNTG
jgi:hypothetical protein